jgi:hypothetical protein
MRRFKGQNRLHLRDGVSSSKLKEKGKFELYKQGKNTLEV